MKKRKYKLRKKNKIKATKNIEAIEHIEELKATKDVEAIEHIEELKATTDVENVEHIEELKQRNGSSSKDNLIVKGTFKFIQAFLGA